MRKNFRKAAVAHPAQRSRGSRFTCCSSATPVRRRVYAKQRFVVYDDNYSVTRHAHVELQSVAALSKRSLFTKQQQQNREQRHLLERSLKRLQGILGRPLRSATMGENFATGSAALGRDGRGEDGETGEERSGCEPAAAADAGVKEGCEDRKGH